MHLLRTLGISEDALITTRRWMRDGIQWTLNTVSIDEWNETCTKLQKLKWDI